MSKYKVGDKARIKSDLIPGKMYGDSNVITAMAKEFEKIVTIVGTVRDGVYQVGENFWEWSDEMLEPIGHTATHIILVKHHQNSSKQFVFEVPDELVGSLKDNMKVLVDTRYGTQEGITTTNVISGKGVKSITQMFGSSFPLQKIQKVLVTKQLSEIIVPRMFESNLPQPEKIYECYSRYRRFGKFDRDIVVGNDNFIYDGYVALLVARMLKIETLSVVVSELSFRKYRSSRGDYP